ncbi:MAG: TIGR00725 family protein [Deltaproteobacteria bacterium]|nr:TIGR00725 family protein [Deltaproteobacteria bacterium]
MANITVKRNPFIIGVMGSHRDDADYIEEARRLGEEIAKRGHVLLTGGGTGIMRAACEGAYKVGGLVIGILPHERKRPLDGYPNEFVDIAIFTGMYDARNVINAKTPHIMIALNGNVGTIAEIVLAMNAGTPVIGLHCPDIPVKGDYAFTRVDSLEEALRKMDELLDRIDEKFYITPSEGV